LLRAAGFEVSVIADAIKACHGIVRNDAGDEQSRDRISAARELLSLLPKAAELPRGPRKVIVEISAPDWLRPRNAVSANASNANALNAALDSEQVIEVAAQASNAEGMSSTSPEHARVDA
jgi:hypothetical protein